MNTFKCELLSVERIWRSDVSQGEDESANEAKWLADLRKTVEALGARWPHSCSGARSPARAGHSGSQGQSWTVQASPRVTL